MKHALGTIILALLTTGIYALSSTSQTSLAADAGLVPHVNTSTIKLSPTGAGEYPRLTNLSDGSLLGTYTIITDTTRTLAVTHSTDGGQSFAALSNISSCPTAQCNLDNPFLLQRAPGGPVVAVYRNHTKGPDGTLTVYRLSTSVSQDGGKTWAFLSHIVQRNATETNNGVWEPFMRLSRADGSLQVYYSSENSKVDQDIVLQSSTDGGKTWSYASTVSGGTTTGRDGMPGCANFNDGAKKLMCVFETSEGDRGGAFSIKSVVSTNEGKTWGQRSQVYAPSSNTSNAGAPQIVQTPDNNLVVSFMTNEDSSGTAFKIVTGPPVATGDWGHKTLVMSPESVWPSVFAKKDGSVLGCSSKGVTCHEITFT